jgi:hypothetical protein
MKTPRDVLLPARLLCIMGCVSAALMVSTSSYAAWFPDQRLTNEPHASYVCANNARPLAADDDGGLHLVWYDYRHGTSEVYYKHFDGATWLEEVRLTDAPYTSDYPSVALGTAGSIHVVWRDFRNVDPEIYYKRFDGTSWQADERLTFTSGVPEDPVVAVDSGGRLHVVWQDYRDGSWGIYYMTHDGVSWSEDVRLSADTSRAYDPSLAVGAGDDVHVVWYDLRDGNFEIYYKAFDGIAWTEDQRLTEETAISENPSVAVDDSGTVHVVWDDNRTGNFEIYHKSFDGLVWSGEQSLTPDSNNSFAPSTATGAGGLHVLWYEISAGYVTFRHVVFDGTSWGPIELVTGPRKACENPAVEVDSQGHVHVVWQEDETGYSITDNYEIYWKWFYNGTPPRPILTSIAPDTWPADEGVRIDEIAGANFLYGASVRLAKIGEDSIRASDVVVTSANRVTCALSLGQAAIGRWDVVLENVDGGADTLEQAFEVVAGMWGEDTRLTEDGASSLTSKPNARCVAADNGGNVHVVWYDDRDGQSEIYYKTFDGAAWGPDTRLTTASSRSEYPSIATDGNAAIHVVWSDERDDRWEIYYKRFDGAWSADERLTNVGGDSRNPSIAADDSNHLHVVWHDNRDNFSQIYYKTYDGATWSTDERLTSASVTDGMPSVAVDGSNRIHVAWYHYSPGSYSIRYRMYDGAWGPEEIISTQAYSGSPSIAADSEDNVCISWHARPPDGGNYEVYFRRLTGTEWLPEERLTHAADYSHNTSVGIGNEGQVYVVWADRRDGNNEIYYKRFDGTAWEPDVRLTFAPGESRHPSVAIDTEGKLHMVWRDERDLNAEIYYRMRDPGLVAAVSGGPGKTAVSALTIVPNPVRSCAHMLFRAPSSGEAAISVYDITGRLVWRHLAEAPEAGRYEVTWDLVDLGGRAVAPGIYFARVASGKTRVSSKVIVLR